MVREGPFGKVRFLAFNTNADLIAMYCNEESTGQIVILKDMRREYARIERTYANATSLTWCGNDCLALTVSDRVVLVSGNGIIRLELKAITEGIFSFNEVQGLHVVTSQCSYFVECVHKSVKEAFAMKTSPAAELLDLQKKI